MSEDTRPRMIISNREGPADIKVVFNVQGEMSVAKRGNRGVDINVLGDKGWNLILRINPEDALSLAHKIIRHHGS